MPETLHFQANFCWCYISGGNWEQQSERQALNYPQTSLLTAACVPSIPLHLAKPIQPKCIGWHNDQFMTSGTGRKILTHLPHFSVRFTMRNKCPLLPVGQSSTNSILCLF
uniref:HDC02699 n=1 Tax=Drosophila melanogaster TaxID=7227 RepID=Q6IHE1_DROME|nr:TPA_inf: HDC02699 [Drosophila melanogaster]